VITCDSDYDSDTGTEEHNGEYNAA
jgi:hypothetical protein